MWMRISVNVSDVVSRQQWIKEHNVKSMKIREAVFS